MSNVLTKSRRKYVSAKEFANQYSLSKAQAYNILKKPEMKDAIIRTGKKSIRIDIDLAFEIMQQIYA